MIFHIPTKGRYLRSQQKKDGRVGAQARGPYFQPMDDQYLRCRRDPGSGKQASRDLLGRFAFIPTIPESEVDPMVP